MILTDQHVLPLNIVEGIYPSFQRKRHWPGRPTLLAVWQEGALLPSGSRTRPGLGTGPRVLVRMEKELLQILHKYIKLNNRFRMRLALLLGMGQSSESTKRHKTQEDDRDDEGGEKDKSAPLSNGGPSQAAAEEDEDTEDEHNQK